MEEEKPFLEVEIVRVDRQITLVSDDCATGYEALKKAGCRITWEYIGYEDSIIAIECKHGTVSSLRGGKVYLLFEEIIKDFNLEKFENWKNEKLKLL